MGSIHLNKDGSTPVILGLLAKSMETIKSNFRKGKVLCEEAMAHDHPMEGQSWEQGNIFVISQASSASSTLTELVRSSGGPPGTGR